MEKLQKPSILSRFMAEMMWAGRSSQGVDSRVNAFNSSIAFDGRMYKQDIEGSVAHATMLGECGIIDIEESKKIDTARRSLVE